MDWFSLWIPAFGMIFAIIDPFGYVPVFLSMTVNNTQRERNHMILRASVTAFIVLVAFTFLGQSILKFFDISIPALQISGGLILLIIGFEMLSVLSMGTRLSTPEEDEGTRKDDISIVPLAIPMLSGPASITTVVVLASKNLSFVNYLVVISSVLITLFVTYWILRSANRLMNILGITGLKVLTRIMGLLMCAMAVQFIINGFKSLLVF